MRELIDNLRGQLKQLRIEFEGAHQALNIQFDRIAQLQADLDLLAAINVKTLQ